MEVDFDWWLHDFKSKVQRSPTPAEFAKLKLEDKLCATSTDTSRGSPLKVIGKSSSKLKSDCLGLNNVKLQTEAAILAELLKSALFSQAFKDSESD